MATDAKVMEKAVIPVIIPFYKNKAQLDKCVAHLRNQTMPVETYIRDNTNDNIFFTAAVNEGIRHFLDKPVNYMIILNQDMYLDRSAVDNMVCFMNQNPRCGIGSPLQLDPRQTDYVIWGGGYEAFPFGRHQHGPLHMFKTDEPICWANGACMIFRRQMVQEIGLLDANLVFIGSDSDYSFTARSRGWDIWRIASACGVHEHGASGANADPLITRLKNSDMLYFCKKWLSGDLYKSMAYEGPQMTPETIQNHLRNLQEAASSPQTA